MTAYHGLQESSYNRLLNQAEQSAQAITNDQLEQAAPDQDTADKWLQLSGDLHFLLVNTCDGAASTICRQNMLGNGFETWRQLHLRYAVPLGTRSIGYLTKLLKPQLDENKFEESFTTWELQLAKYEQDNRTLLPDAILNPAQRDKRPTTTAFATTSRQYHNLCTNQIVEYHSAASQFVKLQPTTSGDNQGPTPMDIGATWYNKGKGKKGKGKNKGKYNKGKGYGGDGNYNNHKGGRGDNRHNQPIGQGNPFKGGYNNKGKGKGYHKGKGYNNYSKGGKGTKGKLATNVCYRCGQPGHMAKQGRVAIYNYDNGNMEDNNVTDDWHHNNHYDGNWHHSDQTQLHSNEQQLALQQGNEQMPLIVSGLEEVIIATATVQQQEGKSNRYIDLMIDSGAATHVCPPWFATESQIQPLAPENGPQLRTVTSQPIKLHGYKWVCMNNINGQRIVIPFYVCDIKQPILSVTRLIEQGFQIVLDDNPRIHHDKGFITRSHGLLFLQAEITTPPR